MDKRQKDTIEAYNITAKDFSVKIGNLQNYNCTYDYLIQILNENDHVLDLACGPCQICKYIGEKKKVNITGVDLSQEMLKLAKENIPGGNFIEDSITSFKSSIFYDLVIIGFGIPYLNKNQLIKCVENSVSLIKENGYFYLSFMDGNKEGYEKTSFGGENKFYVYYHNKDEVKSILENNGLKIIKEYILDYEEQDGRITKDIIYICKKNK